VDGLGLWRGKIISIISGEGRLGSGGYIYNLGPGTCRSKKCYYIHRHSGKRFMWFYICGGFFDFFKV
jgi:hypothetical protein